MLFRCGNDPLCAGTHSRRGRSVPTCPGRCYPRCRPLALRTPTRPCNHSDSCPWDGAPPSGAGPPGRAPVADRSLAALMGPDLGTPSGVCVARALGLTRPPGPDALPRSSTALGGSSCCAPRFHTPHPAARSSTSRRTRGAARHTCPQRRRERAD
jgi:hypothetical protein